MTGTVKKFDAGWGFISIDGGTDVFFHHTGIIADSGQQFKYLVPGDRVSFEMVETERGTKAVKVRKIL